MPACEDKCQGLCKSRKRAHGPMYGYGSGAIPTRRELICCARDQSHLYANSVQRSLKRCICFVVLLQAFLVRPSNSQTTVKNSCPSGCFCVTGKYEGHLVDNLMGDGRTIEAWDRLRSDSSMEVTRTLFCRNSSFFTVPRGLSVISEALFLDDNRISTIKSTDFAPSGDDDTVTSPMIAVAFSNNRISSIQSDAFGSLRNLKLLVLRNNDLHDSRWVATNLPALRQLRELDLSLNKLQCFCAADFGTLPFVERLDLSGNGIEIVEQDALRHFPSLKHLELSNNFIAQHGLIPSIALTPAVKYLSLGDNLLADFASLRSANFFGKLPGLESLDLSGNQAKSGRVPARSFAGLPKIQTLNLSRCGIASLDQGWLEGGVDKSIKILDLSQNLLSTISQRDLSTTCPGGEKVSPALFDLPNITKTPDRGSENQTLRPLTRLIALYLNGNARLHHIHDDAFDFVPNLKFLFLQNCAIRRLNIASERYRYGKHPVANTLPSLAHLWIYGNPIACDCYVRFIKEWTFTVVSINQTAVGHHMDASIYTIGSETQSLDVDSAICVSPPSLAGVTVEAAPGESMTCQEEPYSILIAMLIGPLTFAGSIALTIVCGSLHVSIARMRKGSAPSYYAREELMQNPMIRVRRMKHQHSAFSSIVWNRPHSRDDGHSFRHSVRSGRHTNLVLGRLGSHYQTKSLDDHSHKQSRVEMPPAHLTTNLRVVEHSPCDRKNAGSPSSVEAVNRDEADDKGVRTRSAGRLEVPFVDEKELGKSKFRQGNAKRRLLERSSNGVSDNSSSSGACCETQTFATNNGRSDVKSGEPRNASSAPLNGERTIPGIVTTDASGSEEIFL